jgi:oligopeptidase B
MASIPLAPQRPYQITQHGQTRVDEYFWMREREDPAVVDYLQQENAYLAEMMKHTQPLQEILFHEMKGRIKEDDATVPERRGDYFYYRRNQAGQQYPIYCRKCGSLDALEEIILDQNALAQGKTFCRIGAFAISPDHSKLAYSIDPDGSERCILYIKDLISGELLPEQIQNTFGNVYLHKGVEWGNDSRILFYSLLDPANRPYQIYRHGLGTDPADDQLLYHEVAENYFLWLFKTRSQAYITAWSHSTDSDEWRFLPADQPGETFQVFQARRAGLEYRVEHGGKRFYILTNLEAQNFRLMASALDATALESWHELIPHRQDVLVENVLAFQDYLVLLERKEALKQLRISPVDDLDKPIYVPFPELVYDSYPSANPEFKTHLLRFEYSSLITPNSVIDYHMDTGEWELKKQDVIPSGHDPEQYVSKRLYATAPDGNQVPLSVVYKKGLLNNGQNPTLLHGYGSYGFSLDPEFNASRFSLIERGFVYAIAHVRGGSELGRGWYEDGKMLRKRNTFTDFIAAAETLIALGYTSPDKLAIMGVSAGGLLVGACTTMRPDLFKAVIAKVPFVDVVSTMSDPTIPLTAQEYDEWGNPQDKAYYDYMLSYSPYDNVRAVPYPNLLITSGLNDPRVAYWEPVKFAARLRALKMDDNLLLLKTNMDAGHAGASGRYDFLKEIALEFAFLIDRLGVNPQRFFPGGSPGRVPL